MIYILLIYLIGVFYSAYLYSVETQNEIARRGEYYSDYSKLMQEVIDIAFKTIQNYNELCDESFKITKQDLIRHIIKTEL